MGCGIALVYQSQFQPSPFVCRSLLAAAILALATTVILGYGDISPAGNIISNSGTALLRVFIWGIPSAALVAGSVFLEAIYGLNMLPAMVWLGDASYSIYLTHYFSLTVFDKLWLRSPLQSPDLFIGVALVVAIAIGVVFYLLLEKPLLSLLNQKYSAHRR